MHHNPSGSHNPFLVFFCYADATKGSYGLSKVCLIVLSIVFRILFIAKFDKKQQFLTSFFFFFTFFLFSLNAPVS